MQTLRYYSGSFSSLLSGLFSKANLKALLFLWTPVFLISAFLGLCCVLLPWWLNAGLAMGVIYLALLWFAPWLGFGLYVVLSHISPDFKLADVATAMTLAVFAVRLWMSPQVAPAFPRRMAWPLLTFGVIALISFALAIFYFHNQVPNIYRDGRVFLYWLWMPLLWRWSSVQSDGANKLARVMLWVAITIALLAVFEAATGMQVVAVGLVAGLDPTGGAQGEITRVQMPGFLFVSWAVIWVVLQLIYKRINLVLGGLLLLIFAAALYVNFGRALWAWTAIGVLTPMFFIGSGRAIRMLTILVLSVALSLGGLALVKPSTIDNITTRLLSVKDEGGSKTSYGWRELENKDAMARLQRTPVFGVGVGGEYRGWIPELRRFYEHVRYIHNSYFFVAVKLGIPGLLCLLLILWRSWNGGRQGLAQVPELNRVALLSCLAFLPMSMGLSITQPEFMNTYGVLMFCIVMMILMNCFPVQWREVKRRMTKG